MRLTHLTVLTPKGDFRPRATPLESYGVTRISRARRITPNTHKLNGLWSGGRDRARDVHVGKLAFA